MGDEFAPAYTTLIVATRSRARYWDGDAVRKPVSEWEKKYSGGYGNPGTGKAGTNTDRGDGQWSPNQGYTANGAPLLDWWHVPTPTTIERLTLAMCPQRVCMTCGEPSRRITTTEYGPSPSNGQPGVLAMRENDRMAPGVNQWKAHGNQSVSAINTTLGWSDCGHNTWRPGTVYDPFQRNEHDVTTRYLIGDVFDGLATIPDQSVDLIVTSPPFLALRSYLPADHEHKQLEMGSEPTPGAYLDRLLDVVEECARVLAPHGSLVFELGDTYAGNGDGGFRDVQPAPDVQGRGGFHGSSQAATSRGMGTVRLSGGPGWPLDKSKVMIPQLFAIALAYGFNPLTGRTTPPWRVRNVVAWCRPNPPVGRDGDKFRPATSFLTVATKARDRYWDGDAVRVPHSENAHVAIPGAPVVASAMVNGEPRTPTTLIPNPAGAPLLDYWVIPTEPYSGSHYATFPRALVVPLVKALCPQRVCRVCGEPSRRIVEAERLVNGQPTDALVTRSTAGVEGSVSGGGGEHFPHPGGRTFGRAAETLGWSDCGHDEWRAGCILDPFAGSGTTLAVASGHGLDSIGIDLDARNAELAVERVGGLFLEVETLKEENTATSEPARIAFEDMGWHNQKYRAGYRRPGQRTPDISAYGEP